MFLMQTLVGLVVIALIVVLVGLAIFRPGVLTNLFGTVGDLIEVAVNKLIGRAAVHRLQARLNQEAKRLGKTVPNIESHQAEIKKLQRLVREGEAEVRRLNSRIESCMADNDETGALSYAKELADVEEDLVTNKADAEAMATEYTGLMGDLNASLEDIQAAKKEAGRDARRLKTEQSKADLAKLSRQMHVNTGDSDDGIAALQEKVREQIDAAQGSAKVNADLNVKHRRERDYQVNERNKKAEAILARYKSPAQEPQAR